MKPSRAVWSALLLTGIFLSGGVAASASAWPDDRAMLSTEAGQSPLFTLDTRDTDGYFSGVFTLDTRDLDLGTCSPLFTLDTRGEVSPVSSLFTLDTRGLELSYAPQNLSLVPEQLTVARATWEYFGIPLGFYVQRRAPLGEWVSTTLSGGSVRSWEDTTVQSGCFYEFRVAAVLPNGVSDYSETAYIQMPSLPNRPQGVDAFLTEDGDVTLSWQDMSDDEQGFEIWRKTGSEGAWGSLAQSRANSTSYLDHAVSPATLYTYKMRSSNQWGNSGFSEEVSVAVSDSGTECGYELRVDDADLQLDGIAMATADINVADSRALLQGGLLAFIRSPPGNPHPVRVVLGFRDDEGRAVGNPVEWVDFYCIPGCPGIFVKAEIPEAFRAPESGTHTLWLEMIMAQRDPIDAFTTERHTQESPMRKRLFTVETRAHALAETRVRMLEVSATAGSLVDVPLQLISSGGKYQMDFSVAFDNGIQWIGAELGADAPQALLQTRTSPSNAIGISLMAPMENPFGEGTKHVLTFRFLAEQAGEYALRFQDEPLTREIVSDDQNPAEILWENGKIAIATTGLEGDISPQPNGDGVVDGQDTALARQFIVGVLDLPTDPWAFQRLDCAPIETCGDGLVDMADVVAIKNYEKGKEETKSACGPTNLTERMHIAAPLTRDSSSRNLSIGAPEEVRRGDSFWVTVDLNGQGNEHGLSVSLSFDPDILSYRDMRIVGAATNGVFLPNMEALSEGAIAFGLTLAEEETFASGSHAVAEILFAAQEGNGTVVATVDYVQSPAECRMVGIGSESLECTYSGSDVIVVESIASSAPATPENGQAVALAMDQIKVSWTPVSWATGYRVRRKLEGETVWTKLVDCDETRTVFVDDGLPPGTVCDYLITSLNPQGDESSAIRLQARTWTELEQWRDTWFEKIEDVGLAADAADPDGDAIPNLLEDQLGTDPLIPNELPYRFVAEEVFAGTESLTISYAVSGGAPGHIAFEFTEDLLQPGGWRNQGVAPVSLKQIGVDNLIKLRLPEGVSTNETIFLRMKTE